jgi:hypothetical protein
MNILLSFLQARTSNTAPEHITETKKAEEMKRCIAGLAVLSLGESKIINYIRHLGTKVIGAEQIPYQ